ncbi:MAG: hypothetical protein EOO39_41880 [Cytophagaceae bacterium]|nr:MAG: hypothetical protein EOO39_41880 [Cytophagaceae bacterium]
MTDQPDKDFCDLFSEIHSAIEERMIYRPGDSPLKTDLKQLLLKRSVSLKGLYLIAPDDQHWQLTIGNHIAIYTFVTPHYARGALRILLAQLAFEVRNLFAPDYYQEANEFIARKTMPIACDDIDATQQVQVDGQKQTHTKQRSPEVTSVNPYGFDIVIGSKVRVRTDNTNPNYWLRIDDAP